jgi:hypothetical protein
MDQDKQRIDDGTMKQSTASHTSKVVTAASEAFSMIAAKVRDFQLQHPRLPMIYRIRLLG